MGDRPPRAIEANDENSTEISVPSEVASPEAITLPGIGALPGIASPGGSRDEGSVPPMGDLDARFFEIESDPFATADSEPRRLSRSLQRAAVPRRERFVRFVACAVALCAILCGAALVKTAVVGTEKGAQEPGHTFAAAAAVAPVALGGAPAMPVAPIATGLPIAPAAVDVTPPEVLLQAAAAAPAALSVATPAADAVEGAEPGPATALEERGISRDALEHGKIALSIEAGERSVALDPTDAEAWLVLGAAYQERGKLTEARRCYKACLTRATWGPRAECRELLR
jgi:hypothetical protein